MRSATEAAEAVIHSKLLQQGAGAPPRDDAWLLVREGRIAAIGREAQRLAAGNAEVVELGDAVLAPALIDGHVHLVWSGAPGALFEAIGKPPEWLACRAIANMRNALAAGITVVRDCGGVAGVVLAAARAVREGLLPGPVVVTSGAPITTTGGHCWFLGLEAVGTDACLAALRRMDREGVDFIKVMVTGGGSTPGSNVRASQYAQAELSAMASEAHSLHKWIAGHVHGTEGIERALEAGFDSLEHCSWLAKSGAGIDFRPELADLIVRRRVGVCRTIAGFERWPLEELGKDHFAWGDFDALRKMHDRGVHLFAGTDAGIDRTAFDGLQRTLETMVGLGGMTHREAFESATVRAAEAIGLSGDHGTLEVGKRADCIALDGDPCADIRALRHVRTVLVGGRVVVRQGLEGPRAPDGPLSLQQGARA